MHYGRYGSGSDDERLRPLFLGYPNLVRGYDLNTIDESECVATAVERVPGVGSADGKPDARGQSRVPLSLAAAIRRVVPDVRPHAC